MRRLIDMVSSERIVWLETTSREDFIRELAGFLSKAPEISNPEEFIEAIIEREKIMSTGIGLGLAIPHAKIASVKDFVLAMGISRVGLDFGAIDDLPVHIVVMIATPEREKDNYVRVLAKVVRILKSEDVRKGLIEARDAGAVEEVIRQWYSGQIE
ncbi:MAG: PTS sugar transporter subunit IIA [Planctomycetota bacterium]|nr:PTS sugar transporter subunit IIA [Planctomycetota bacterium]